MYVDETRWNNNNIFELLGGLSLFVVDQRFKDWFDAQHFNNASLFIPDSEMSINNGNYDSRVKEYGQEGLRYDLD